MTEPQKKLVYVVEDDEQQLYVLRIILSDAGYNVVTETSADRVLEGVKALQPDIILLDVMLPSAENLDGFNLCSRIRTTPGFENTIILLVSAIAQGTGPDKHKMVTQVGANDFIVKPYDPPELIQRIREHGG